tara:strand:+ start:7685 stop:7849 length:165 start_codon:yes stop_codon:yes gene_type:complete
MPNENEPIDDFYEIAEILDGWFPDLYVDTSLRFREKKNQKVVGDSKQTAKEIQK